jgi:rod shape-determining protein MreC
VAPTGTESAPEEVLVIVDPVHQEIPDAPTGDAPVFLAPDVKAGDQSHPPGGNGLTTADKLRDEYKKIGDAQKHTFGVGEPGTLPPNFNLKVPGVNAPGVNAPAAPAASSSGSPEKKPETAAKPPASVPAAPPATRSPAPPPKEPQP